VIGDLDVLITPQTISQALSAGFEGDVLKARLETLAALPDPIARTLTQVSAVIGRGEFVGTTGFLWVEDPEVRELLRTRRQTMDLFIDPSPPSGLLVTPGVDLERLARRCRTLGVEVVVDGEIYRTRTVSPGKGSGARRLESSGSLNMNRGSSRPPGQSRTPAPGTYRTPSSTRTPSPGSTRDTGKRRTGE
jgi:hypothetical protein